MAYTVLQASIALSLGILAALSCFRLLATRAKVETIAPVAASSVDAAHNRPDRLARFQDHTHQLQWEETALGDVVRANAAYLRHACIESGPNGIAKLFTKLDLDEAGRAERLAWPEGSAAAERYFDVQMLQTGGKRLFFADDVTQHARRDDHHRDMVRTISKTFAQLTIGIAIFDKDRKVAMFNPSLVDMTGLDSLFLAKRPTLDAVLDALRESRLLPEPKDYVKWRENFAPIEKAKQNAISSEYWSLPHGETFRVTGRSHSDGSFALMLEDVTAEIGLTRQFRSDIKAGQAVMDALPDAIAVFSEMGTLVMSNERYRQLWDVPMIPSLSQREIADEMAIWADKCMPTAVWGDLQGYLAAAPQSKEWRDNLLLANGRPLHCFASALGGGLSMVRFAAATDGIAMLHDLPRAATRNRKSH